MSDKVMFVMSATASSPFRKHTDQPAFWHDDV
jgi:hypothetical protein